MSSLMEGGDVDLWTAVKYLLLLAVTLKVVLSSRWFRARTMEEIILDSLPGGRGDPEEVQCGQRFLEHRGNGLIAAHAKAGCDTFCCDMSSSKCVVDALGQARVIATADPKLCKALMMSRVHTEKRPERYRLARKLPGMDGVLFQDGEIWKRHTRALLPVFHGSNYAKFTKIMHTTAVEHFTRWFAKKDDRGGGGDDDAKEVDVLPLLHSLAIDIMMSFGYGLKPGSRLADRLRTALEGYDEKERFRVGGGAGQNGGGFSALFRLPWALYRVYKDYVGIRDATKEVLDDDKRAETSRGEDWPADAVDWITQMQNADFPLGEIGNEVCHLRGAHKAIAIMMSFVFYRLTKNSDWAAKAKAEMDAVMMAKKQHGKLDDDVESKQDEDNKSPQQAAAAGCSSSSSYPTRDDIASLPICMAIFRETLRMHPISLGIVRETGEDLEVSPGLIAPPNTMILMLVHVLHHHPDHWDAPEKFNPGRWLDNKEHDPIHGMKKKKESKFAYFPFMEGQRQCQGRFLVELEYVIMLHAFFQIAPYGGLPKGVPGYDLRIGPDFFPEAEKPILILK